MTIESGRMLAHYRLVEQIGEGGMGVVWRAVDTTLDREVAIKVLPAALATDADRLARFDREAKLLASLNHPNIAAVYGFHDSDGVRFAAMELVAGEDLARRIARGPVPVDEALEIATHIAHALAAAHDRGVVHRDLKPANVVVAPDGTVKVLDFGLAKSLEPDGVASGDPEASPTMTTGGTALGVILGTAAYMSPEQARGRAVDRRADLWAFGCVLYEMLTGTRAFDGETITDTLSAVISREPDWDRLPASTPAAVRRLLRRCLDKRLAHRVRDAGDARLDLLEPDAPPSDVDGGASTARPARRVPGLALAALAGAALVAVAWWLAPAPAPDPTVDLPLLRQATFTGEVGSPSSFGFRGNPQGLDLAADGRTAVFMTRDANRAILIDLDGGGNRTLFSEPGTSLFDVAWSPDGGRVYLMTWPYAERVLSVPRLGGEPRQELDLHKLAGLNGILVRPLPGDRWLIGGDHNTIYVGPDPQALETRGTQLHGEGVFKIAGIEHLHQIAISRDGNRIAYRGTDADGRSRGGVVDMTGAGFEVEAWADLTPIDWADDDRTLFLWRRVGLDVGDLLRVRIDPATGRPTAAPEPVYPRLAARHARVSADGTRLLACAGDRVANLREFSLDATPRSDDNPTRVRTEGTGRWAIRDFMPDGTLLAGLSSALGWELFAIAPDDTRRSLIRLDDEPRAVAASRDGSAVAMGIESPAPAVLIHDVAGNRNRTIPVPEPLSSVDWSPDGKFLAAMTWSSPDRIVVVDVERGEARRVDLDCGDRCEFAYEGIRTGPEWPYALVTSEVDTWIADVETGALRHVAANTWTVVGWIDGQLYFARGGGQTDGPGFVLFRVPVDGGSEERVLDLPPECVDFELAPDERSVVCAADESRLDLYLLDGI